jgi:hypothetical protein
LEGFWAKITTDLPPIPCGPATVPHDLLLYIHYSLQWPRCYIWWYAAYDPAAIYWLCAYRVCICVCYIECIYTCSYMCYRVCIWVYYYIVCIYYSMCTVTIRLTVPRIVCIIST